MTAHHDCDACGGSGRTRCYQVERFGTSGRIHRSVQWLCGKCKAVLDGQTYTFKDGWGKSHEHPVYKVTELRNSE